jgi:hypothetical protein
LAVLCNLVRREFVIIITSRTRDNFYVGSSRTASTICGVLLKIYMYRRNNGCCIRNFCSRNRQDQGHLRSTRSCRSDMSDSSWDNNSDSYSTDISTGDSNRHPASFDPIRDAGPYTILNVGRYCLPILHVRAVRWTLSQINLKKPRLLLLSSMFSKTS